MPKGKRWSPEESFDLAQAWINVSEDAGEVEVKGVNQDSDEFWSRVRANFKARGPTVQDGTYGDRAVTAIMNHWKDNISRECKRFNKSLLKVHSCNLSGVNQQDKINIAVAIHMGKSDCPAARLRKYQPMNWKFYQCWLALKDHRAFVPPQASAPIVDVDDDKDDEEDDDDEEERTESAGNESGDTPGSTTESGRALFTTPSQGEEADVNTKATARGPGPGGKKTRASAAEDEYRKKKTKIQEGILEVQRKRQSDFEAYIKNMSRATAFKMAMSAYQMFKDDDPVQAMRYKNAMSSILSGDTAADEHDDMPTLFENAGTGV
jgi:sRNA-binding regulator protein Hfq